MITLSNHNQPLRTLGMLFRWHVILFSRYQYIHDLNCKHEIQPCYYHIKLYFLYLPKFLNGLLVQESNLEVLFHYFFLFLISIFILFKSNSASLIGMFLKKNVCVDKSLKMGKTLYCSDGDYSLVLRFLVLQPFSPTASSPTSSSPTHYSFFPFSSPTA